LTSEYMKFLQEKGYMKKHGDSANSVEDKEDVAKSLRQFQWFAGVPVTGKMDWSTLLKFKQPRCGMKDLDKRRRYRRYILQGSKWNKKSISFRILNYSSDLSKNDIRLSIKRAFSRWQSATQIRFFEKKEGIADIMIQFSRKSHGDPYPFDGPGGTLGHAFYPEHHSLGGDTHFDDDETFTLNKKDGKNFYWVALHEFGHALGLEHSKTKGTVMFPWYENFNGKEVDLTPDDRRGIQKLYGKPMRRTFDVSRFKSKYIQSIYKRRRRRKSSCIDRIDAIFLDKNRESIVINDEKVYVYDRNLRLVQGPLHLKKYFEGVKKVDSIYRSVNGTTRIFHAGSYWDFNGVNYIRGPLNMSSIGIPKELHHLNAAFRWREDNKVYLFKGKRYWHYNESTGIVSQPGLINIRWPGIHGKINTVFQWRNKNIHFFKGNQFYMFDRNGTKLLPGYPLPVQHNLLICKKKHLLGYLKEYPTTSSGTDRFPDTTSGADRFPDFNRLLMFLSILAYLHFATLL